MDYPTPFWEVSGPTAGDFEKLARILDVQTRLLEALADGLDAALAEKTACAGCGVRGPIDTRFWRGADEFLYFCADCHPDTVKP